MLKSNNFIEGMIESGTGIRTSSSAVNSSEVIWALALVSASLAFTPSSDFWSTFLHLSDNDNNNEEDEDEDEDEDADNEEDEDEDEDEDDYSYCWVNQFGFLIIPHPSPPPSPTTIMQCQKKTHIVLSLGPSHEQHLVYSQSFFKCTL